MLTALRRVTLLTFFVSGMATAPLSAGTGTGGTGPTAIAGHEKVNNRRASICSLQRSVRFRTMMIVKLSAAIFLMQSSLVAGFALQSPSRNVRTFSRTVLFDAQQAEYGKSLEFPNTYVKCGKCQSIYAIKEEDFGPKGRGRRLSCSVCSHSWFQSRDRLMTIRDDFELVPLPDADKERIAMNIDEGKDPGFLGDAKVYVGNISFQCREDDLLEIFSGIGEVGDVSIVRDNEGKNRGFGFITMRSKVDAEKAVAALDGREVRGRKLTVRESNS